MKKIDRLSAFHMFANSYEEALDLWFDEILASLDVMIRMSLQEDLSDLRQISLDAIDDFISTANKKISMLMLEYVHIANEYLVPKGLDANEIFKKKMELFIKKGSKKLKELSSKAEGNIISLSRYNDKKKVPGFLKKEKVLNKIIHLTWVQFVTDMKNGNHPLD